MKKVLFAVLIATSLFSCKNETLVSTDSKSDTIKVDSIKVDSTKADSTKVDSVK